MKRITKITIENYRAYASEATINLPHGENLLLYGENGSGKSSLYRAIHHFMASSVDVTKTFDCNYYSGKKDGKIEVEFCDFIGVNSKKPGSEHVFKSSSDTKLSDNQDSDIQLGYRVSGFLDYSRLLKVYLNRGDRPNLFELVIELLSDYIPIKQGLTESIGKIYNSVNTNIASNYHRTDREYKKLSNDGNKLIGAFSSIITDLNAIFSQFMSKYFTAFNLKISLVNPMMVLFQSGRIRDTRLKGELFLDVQHFGQGLKNYNNTLNEARLSAIAICLYLSSLKLRGVNSETKLLYLDDAFVGLDAANRRPVMSMLANEFQDYQIFISTYDKSWFHLAEELINNKDDWKFIELYEGHELVGGLHIPKPIIVSGNSNIEKARQHLYDNLNPDYPAAANYLRKAYEGMLATKLYRHAILDDNLEPIATFKINSLLLHALTFLSSIPKDPFSADIIKELNQLRSFLRPLLHPLSHYAPDDPVYRSELFEASDLYDKISNMLDTSDYKNRCHVIIEKGNQLMFKISGTDWTYKYIMEVEEDLLSYTDDKNVKHLSSTPMQVVKMCEECHGIPIKTIIVRKSNRIGPALHFLDIEDCINTISSHLSQPEQGKSDRVILPNKLDMFYCMAINPSPAPCPPIEFTEQIQSRM